ncbi:MAG: DUF3228 family protein [Candidatus Marinimicrobia bacterium]|nr:DUF3228 family protein [Candidatus Neomarinimicrobiota bacterium]MCH7762292.1 DUF3228 family protein [Candidatus Neomarinimicrobiota bacterium]
MQKVAVNDFVRRQVKGSGKTYSPDLSFEDIAKHAKEQMALGNFKEGYRDGVRIVQCSLEMARHFYCPFARIDESSKLKAEVVRRRPDEEPYIQIRVINGDHLPSGKVEFILYRHDVLAENNEQSTEAEWELVSIHAIPDGVEPLPMGPVTMMRNQLEMPGGTKAHYTSEEWAESVRFWQRYGAISNTEEKEQRICESLI